MPRSRKIKLQVFVGSLVEAGAAVLEREMQVSAERAHNVMFHVARAVCLRNAKSLVYVPEARNLTNLERNARIWAAYQADNPLPPYTRRFTPARLDELAAEHDLTAQQVYNIVRGARESEVAQRQADRDLGQTGPGAA